MTFAGAIAQALKNYASFKGVASRRAYWYWRLFLVLVNLVAGVIDGILSKKLGFDATYFVPTQALTSLAFFLPDLAVTARRLHDVGRTAWLLLLQVVPLLLAAAVVYLYITENVDLMASAPHMSQLAQGLTLALVGAGVATSVFFLVLTLGKTVTKAQGNRYAPDAEFEPLNQYPGW
jgi:uncharacterized membrane protein YhaH (DUF805 family)